MVNSIVKMRGHPGFFLQEERFPIPNTNNSDYIQRSGGLRSVGELMITSLNKAFKSDSDIKSIKEAYNKLPENYAAVGSELINRLNRSSWRNNDILFQHYPDDRFKEYTFRNSVFYYYLIDYTDTLLYKDVQIRKYRLRGREHGQKVEHRETIYLNNMNKKVRQKPKGTQKKWRRR